MRLEPRKLIAPRRATGRRPVKGQRIDLSAGGHLHPHPGWDGPGFAGSFGSGGGGGASRLMAIREQVDRVRSDPRIGQRHHRQDRQNASATRLRIGRGRGRGCGCGQKRVARGRRKRRPRPRPANGAAAAVTSCAGYRHGSRCRNGQRLLAAGPNGSPPRLARADCRPSLSAARRASRGSSRPISAARGKIPRLAAAACCARRKTRHVSQIRRNPARQVTRHHLLRDRRRAAVDRRESPDRKARVRKAATSRRSSNGRSASSKRTRLPDIAWLTANLRRASSLPGSRLHHTGIGGLSCGLIADQIKGQCLIGQHLAFRNARRPRPVELGNRLGRTAREQVDRTQPERDARMAGFDLRRPAEKNRPPLQRSPMPMAAVRPRPVHRVPAARGPAPRARGSTAGLPRSAGVGPPRARPFPARRSGKAVNAVAQAASRGDRARRAGFTTRDLNARAPHCHSRIMQGAAKRHRTRAGLQARNTAEQVY